MDGVPFTVVGPLEKAMPAEKIRVRIMKVLWGS